MKPHILLTRPIADSEEMSPALCAAGTTVSAEPMLRIEYLDYNTHFFNLSAGLIVTSKNAARAISRAHGGRAGKRIYAVGPATARVLIENGFENVICAAGTARSLKALILDDWAPGDGLLTYVSGAHITEDLAETLKHAGLTTARTIVYRAAAVRRLSPALLFQLRTHDVDIVLFFSKRSARIFTRLIAEHAMAHTLHKATALVISAKVGDALNAADWGQIHVARTPSGPDMISRAHALAAHGAH